MFKLIRFLKGFYEIRLYGYAPERFMNLCNNHNISLWDVIKAEDGYIFKIFASDFYKTKEFLDKTNTRAVVHDKVGLPFIFRQYYRRYMFVLGLIFCFLILFCSTRFVFSFQIEGNYSVTHDMYISFLEEEGIKSGIPKKKINLDELEKKFRQKYQFITWASFEISGTKMKLKVKESESSNEIDSMDEDTGYDLCATVSGNIMNMVTRKGTPVVKIKDEVVPGQILISGILPIIADDEQIIAYNYTNADGDIFIEYRAQYKDFQKYNYNKKIYTGEYEKSISFGIGNYIYEIGMPIRFHNCDHISECQIMNISLYKEIPIFAMFNKYIEYDIEKRKYSKDECISILGERYADYEERLIENQIKVVEKNVKIEYYKNGVSLSIDMILCKKDGKKVPTNICN